MTKTKTTLDRSDDTQYGSAANGTQVGSGFDVEIKRESARVALVNVIELATKEEWLGQLDVEPEEDLQALAVHIGNCPGDWLTGLESNDPEIDNDWDDFVDRWEAIAVD